MKWIVILALIAAGAYGAYRYAFYMAGESHPGIHPQVDSLREGKPDTADAG